MKNDTTNEIKTPEEKTTETPKMTEEDLNTFANQLSSVLRNPNLPADIYNAIMEAKDKISDFNNSQILTDYETSPEHLEAILKVVCGSVNDGGDASGISSKK